MDSNSEFDLLDERISILAGLIEQINSLKASRSWITREAVKEIDEDLDVFLRYHEEIAPAGHLSDFMLDRRSHIERSILKLKEHKRRHESRGWQDIILLEKELVTLLSEYKMLKALKESVD